jgi:hypothetical protein
MRFLAGMRAGMYRQGRPLDEALGALWKITAVWAFIGMYPVVSAKI